ncbi:MAG TPA: transposase [Thermoanaerobaculia bacterium]|nr:transposase [Thermoanaerobaculia bacterium]
MRFDPDRHRRRSLRLKSYDYSQAGGYYVTVVAQDRESLFGEVTSQTMRLNDAGRMVDSVWRDLALFYPGVRLDAFVVMPNHIHGVLFLVGATPRGCPPGGGRRGEEGQARGPAPTASLSLPDVVHRFKTLTTRRYIEGVKQQGWMTFRARLWQRNYHEHVIRDEESLALIREYIANNPAGWAEDQENPGRLGP